MHDSIIDIIQLIHNVRAIAAEFHQLKCRLILSVCFSAAVFSQRSEEATGGKQQAEEGHWAAEDSAAGQTEEAHSYASLTSKQRPLQRKRKNLSGKPCLENPVFFSFSDRALFSSPKTPSITPTTPANQLVSPTGQTDDTLLGTAPHSSQVKESGRRRGQRKGDAHKAGRDKLDGS